MSVTQLHAPPRINPDKNQICLALGRKGSGKSVWAYTMFREWPGVDKLVIDPTGDADPGVDIGTRNVHKPPMTLPEATRRGEHTVTRYLADPASATYKEDLDRALAAALYPKDRHSLTWVDEAGEVFPAGRLGPNARTLLHQSRHWYASLIMCSPRALHLDPLCIAQADHVILYDLPHPHDRERVAANTANGGLGSPREFYAELDALRDEPPHSFLWYVAAEHQMYLCPPLPLDPAYKRAQGN